MDGWTIRKYNVFGHGQWQHRGIIKQRISEVHHFTIHWKLVPWLERYVYMKVKSPKETRGRFLIHFFCIVTEYWNFHLNTDTRSLTFCDHVNIKSQSNYYNYFYCCDFFLALQRELPLGLSLIKKVTQVDHDNVTSLRLDPPLQRELWWIAGLKVIRLHRTRGSLLMSLFSVPTNQAAPHKATSLPAGIKTDVQPGGSKRSSWGSLQLSYRTACSSSFQWISEYVLTASLYTRTWPTAFCRSLHQLSHWSSSGVKVIIHSFIMKQVQKE